MIKPDFTPPEIFSTPKRCVFAKKPHFPIQKMGFLYLTHSSLLVPHILGLQWPLVVHSNLQISPPMGVLIPRSVTPHSPSSKWTLSFGTGGKVFTSKTPATQSLTNQNWWLVAHFKAMGVSFYHKKLEVYGGGTNRVFCQYFIDLTRSEGRKLSTIPIFSQQIPQLPLKFIFLFSF